MAFFQMRTRHCYLASQRTTCQSCSTCTQTLRVNQTTEHHWWTASRLMSQYQVVMRTQDSPCYSWILWVPVLRVFSWPLPFCFHCLVDSRLLESFFAKAMGKLRQEDLPASSKHLVFDLAHCFVPYLCLESLNTLYGYLTPLLDVSYKY